MISFTDHYNDISFDRVSSETKYGKDSRQFNNYFSRLKKRLRIFFKKENFKSVINQPLKTYKEQNVLNLVLTSDGNWREKIFKTIQSTGKTESAKSNKI